jgi:hypothetical protein
MNYENESSGTNDESLRSLQKLPYFAALMARLEAASFQDRVEGRVF